MYERIVTVKNSFVAVCGIVVWESNAEYTRTVIPLTRSSEGRVGIGRLITTQRLCEPTAPLHGEHSV